MKKNNKRIIITALVVVALMVAFAGGYWTARYQYRQSWAEISEIIREGGKVKVEKFPTILPSK